MIRKTCGVLVLGLVALGLSGPGAAAHVTVNPSQATAGSYAKLAFRVPNERADASTIKLEVQFPADAPMASVSIKPTPGWTATIIKRTPAPPATTANGNAMTEAIDTVSWSGGAIRPGEFQEFEISLGPLPKNVAAMPFRALQTYDNGEVVRWVEDRVTGQPEPAKPAPVLQLVAAEASTTTTASAAAPTTTGAADDGGSATDSPPEQAPVSDTTARTLGAIGLVAGVIGLVVGVVALGRRRPGA